MSGARPGTADSLAAALNRMERTLFRWPVLEAVIARREAGVPEPSDPRRAAALAATICDRAAPDGSWCSDLIRTAETLLLLREIALVPDARTGETAAAASAWLLGRRDKPGRFGEGCDAASHEAGLCEHVMTGLFSAADPAIDLGGTMLATGGRFQSDAAARFAASCLALRALVAWNQYDAGLEPGLAAVRSVLMRHAPAAEPLGCAGYVCAIAAVGAVRDSEPDRVAALSGLARLASVQRGDGSWPGVDLFHVLEALTSPSLAWHRLDPAEAAIRRAAGMLSLMQGPDGSSGMETGPTRTLAGWRTLRRALADSTS